ncbi:FtsK/SpoIIIE domain-containing protein [Mesorhizobium caraganae]|uniref:FtsK/SpoIIIE domain-containing protein n=1 Tax=Mesorhizobium caraganae TaxID=483206 RepID=UPI003ED07B20
MVARVQLTKSEREIVERIKREGWRSKLDNWTIGRLALARSLQLPDVPDRDAYKVLAAQPGGIELHSQQLTGEGKGSRDDVTDLYRSLLSVYEGTDLFADDDEFHAALQRHVRRGLAAIAGEWDPKSDINRYVVEELFAERSVDAEPSVRDAELGARVTRVLGQIGVGATLLDTFEGPRLTRFTYELAQLGDLDRLKRGIGKIGFALGLGERVAGLSVGTAERTVLLDIPRAPATWKTVEWSQLRGVLRSEPALVMALPVALGTDVVGEPLLVDLAEAPHLFVGGTTGSGKSMCLHTILLSLIDDMKRAPDLLLVDPKTVEFAGYKGLPNLITGAPVVTADAAVVALEGLVEEMDRRQAILNEFGAKDIAEAISKGAKLKRIVAIIDELGDLFMTREEIELPLIRLAQKARSVGIHLVLATQRPEAATFPGMLRSNIPSRIGLTVQKAAESRIILDEGGAEELLGRGDMLVKFTGRSMTRAHGCRVLPSDIGNAVR